MAERLAVWHHAGMSKKQAPSAPPKPRARLPACLAPAMLEWALEQSPEESQRLLSLPKVAGRESKAMVPPKKRA